VSYAYVLDDELLMLWHQFKQGVDVEKRKLEKFLRHYRPPHLTNIEQLKRCGIDDEVLGSALAGSGFLNQPLEELAQHTHFKFILTAEDQNFPYVHFDQKPVSSELAYRFLPNEPRDRLHQHLKQLLANAKVVVLADRYLGQERFHNAKQIFNLFPSTACTVCLTYELENAQKTQIKESKPNLKLINDTRSNYSGLHDRYLLIDNTVEITLTSGIDYLFDTSKECTAIIRLHEAKR
jgi:hypothetical protein